MTATDPTGRVSHLPDMHRGVAWKQPVRVASTANGTISTAFANGQTVDGITLATGDRILLKDQTAGSANGIYTVNASGAPTRAFDMDQDQTTAIVAEEVMGAVVYVIAGTANGGTFWGTTNTAAPTLGTTAITWVQRASVAAFATPAIVLGTAAAAGAAATTIRSDATLLAFDATTPANIVAAAAVTYRSTVLADSPIGYWRLGESSGTVANDSAPGVSNGTYIGTPTLGAAGAISGDSDTAVTFNGTTQYVSVPSNAGFNTANGAFSIEAWTKRSATNANHAILSKGTGAYYFRWRNDGYLNLLRSNQADIAVSNTTHLDTNWHHVVVTYAGANGAIKFYFDGADDSTAGPWTPNFVSNTTALTIGSDNGGANETFAGTLDEPAFYNVVLTPAQVLAHYTARTAAAAVGTAAVAARRDHVHKLAYHSESLTDGASNFIFAKGDIVTVTGVANP